MAQLLFGPGNSESIGSVNSGGVGVSKSFSKANLYNVEVGDLLLVWIGSQDASATSTITPPSGWVRYGAATGSPNITYSRLSGFYYYPVPNQAALDAIPANITFSFSSTGARTGLLIARAIGVDLTNIEDSAATAFNYASATASFDVNAISTNHTNTLLVGGIHRHNSPNTSVPTVQSFMTDSLEYNTTPTSTPTVASTSAIMGYEHITAAGNTGPKTAVLSSQATTIGGELVAFRALDSSNPPDPVTHPFIATPVPTVYSSASAPNTFTIDNPGGLQDGDLLVMALTSQTSSATTDYASPGWSRISRSFIPNSIIYRLSAFYAMPVPVAADVAATSFTFTNTDASTSWRMVATMFIVRGADLSGYMAGASEHGTSANTETVINPDFESSASKSLLLVQYSGHITSGNSPAVASGPAGMAQYSYHTVASANNTVTPLTIYQEDVEQGPVGTKTLSWAGPSARSVSDGIVIKGLSSESNLPGKSIHYVSTAGTLASGRAFYTSSTDTLSEPLEIRPVPTGYASVSAMLATSPIYVAHRGGSIEWPEMSLHAYTQSVFWGVGALELSLARTSDGVWFGLHDQNINRTSGTTGIGAASTMTWAQIQSYQILGSTAANDPSQPSRPYMRLEEIINTYYSTHILFLDIKYAAAFQTEFISNISALPGTPQDRIVGKAYGVAATFPNAMRAAGFKTWGYFYESQHVSGDMATYQNNWDILGMDYIASQAAWNAVLSFGKPVLAHILPNAAALATAQNKAAASPNPSNLKGYMVSGVKSVVPRSPSSI